MKTRILCSLLSLFTLSSTAGVVTSADIRTSINGSMTLQYSPLDAGMVTVSLDGVAILSSTNAGSFVWQPQTLGSHTLTHTAGTNVWNFTLNVTGFDYFVQAAPNPPMAQDSAIAITPVTRSIPQSGGAAAIVTSGSGTWTAAVSDSWITLNATSGSAGYPVDYSVGLNTNIEDRVGYVYVSGYTHTVTQAGIGATLDHTNAEFECDGGTATVTVIAQNLMTWQARSNADWISVSPTQGAGESSVTIQVAPWHDVSTRSGTLTIAGQTFTVFQYGRRIKLSSYASTCDYLTHVIPITVNALAVTTWSVTPQASWISVVDAGNGRGGDTVSIAVAENPSYVGRTGTVTIGTETYTVTQEGQTNLEFSISPTATMASQDGTNGLIAVTATPDLPWTASANQNWVTINSKFLAGTGSGNIAYTVLPNSTLTDRRATITVVPDAASSMPTRTYSIMQPAAVAALSSYGYEFEETGGSTTVEVTVADIVEWQVVESCDWITISGSTSRVGPETVTIVVSANSSVEPRGGRVVIAGRNFYVSQTAREMVSVGATADGGGTVADAGSYGLGETAKLTAVPNDGYAFDYWTLPDGGESMANPLFLTVDVAKSVVAHFSPLTPEFITWESSTNGVDLVWTNLAWATEYRIYRGEAAVPSSADVIATLVADGTHAYRDATGEVEVSYWYWVEAVGSTDTTMSQDAVAGKRTAPPVFSPISYTDLRGTTHTNPATYEEGKSLGLSNPVGRVTGYTFAGWSPAAITSEMKGAQTVTALWTPNTYTIVYSANGGSGTMAPTAATYDQTATLATNGFLRANHDFLGWSTTPDGDVVYAEGETVDNLTTAQGGVVTLYAVWKLAGVASPVITPGDGSVFAAETCTVTITCAMDGASIYYTTNGTTPKTSSKYLYTGPFTIDGDANIKAVAVLESVKSVYVTAHISKVALTLANALDVAGTEGIALTTGGDADWEAIRDASAKVGGMCAVSGVVLDEEESWIEAAVSGAGTLSYWVRTSCEHDDDNTFTWDHIEVLADGVEVAGQRQDGDTAWTQRSVVFAAAGSHTVRWMYVKDESEDDGDDCVWLDGLVWTPAETPTETDPIPELGDGATAGQIAEALSGSADEANLVENLADRAAYAAYRAWAGTVKDGSGKPAGHAAVKACANAWLSYALDCDALVEKAPEQGDLVMEDFSMDARGCRLVLRLAGVDIGANATAENLAKVFSIGGSSTLDGAFSQEAVDTVFQTPAGGKAAAIVNPKAPADTFFFRAKMK